MLLGIIEEDGGFSHGPTEDIVQLLQARPGTEEAYICLLGEENKALYSWNATEGNWEALDRKEARYMVCDVCGNRFGGDTGEDKQFYWGNCSLCGNDGQVTHPEHYGIFVTEMPPGTPIRVEERTVVAISPFVVYGSLKSGS